MKIITRYLIREFVKPLFFTVAVFGGLVMISEFFRELSFYLENKTSFVYVFAYLLLNFPWWTIQVLPVAVLLAVLFSLGELARRGEITAMKAAGINLWRVVILFMIFGVCITATELFLREKVIPLCVQQAEYIRQDKIKIEKSAKRTDFYNLVVSIPPNARMTIGYLNARDNVIQQAVIDYYDQNFTLQRQVIAGSGAWQDNVWRLKDGVERTFPQGHVNDTPFKEQMLSLPFQPKDFIIDKVRPEQMTTQKFRAYLTQLRKLGIPADKDLIQYHSRLASAASHIIVMLIGIPFALGLGSKHGKIISFSFALIFAFIYWGFQAIGQSFGENRLISPLLAAWLGNLIFTAAGLVMVSKIRK